MKKLLLLLVSILLTVNCFASTFYIDPANGNDSNDGSTWALAWKTITSGATAARIAPGDVIKIAKSPDPTSLGQNATWTNGSNVVALTSAVTANIDMCESAWTASTNVTCSTSAVSAEGSATATFTIAAAFTTGKIAYKTLPSTLDLSGYQQISFWYNNQSLNPSGVGFAIRLCSDTTGDTVVNSFSIPNVALSSRSWIAFTINYGSSLGSAIRSVSLAVTSDPSSGVFWLDDIVACKASGSTDSLSLVSLISKNSLAQGGDEPWLPIKSINGTSIVLAGTNSTVVYGGTTETCAAYKREPFVSASDDTGNAATINDSGTSSEPIIFTGGCNTSTGDQDGESYFSRGGYTSGCYGLVTDGTIHDVIIDRLNFVYFYYGAYIYGNSNTIQNISVGGNGRGIALNGVNNIIENVGFAGLQWGNGYPVIISGFNNKIGTINYLYGTYNASGVDIFGFNCSITEIKSLSYAAGSSYAYGVYFERPGNSIGKLTSSNCSMAGIYCGGESYVKEYTSTDATPVLIVSASGARLSIDKYQDEDNNRYIFIEDGTVEAQAATRHTASGFAWKFSPGSSRTYSYPLSLSLTKVICFANKLTTISCYVKKDDASAVGASLVCKGGQIAGVTSDVITTASSGTDWEKLTISFTPTEDGVVEIEGWGYYVSGTSYVYFDDISTAIENSQSINLNSLDYSWEGQPLSVNTATTRSFTWVN